MSIIHLGVFCFGIFILTGILWASWVRDLLSLILRTSQPLIFQICFTFPTLSPISWHSNKVYVQLSDIVLRLLDVLFLLFCSVAGFTFFSLYFSLVHFYCPVGSCPITAVSLFNHCYFKVPARQFQHLWHIQSDCDDCFVSWLLFLCFSFCLFICPIIFFLLFFFFKFEHIRWESRGKVNIFLMPRNGHAIPSARPWVSGFALI